MSDTEIVQAIIAGDPSGLADAYRRYADRLYDYCARTLDDRDAAADAVHDTFIILRERAAQLREPDALRPWLYAIARSRCLRLLRDRRRRLPLDEVTDMHDDTLEAPEAGPHREDLRNLVRSALAGLNPREREVIDLTLRHELTGLELAGALGVPVKQAHAVASTARAQLKRALDTVVLARTRGRDCAGLRSLLAAWDGELTPMWRKRIGRHIDSCTACAEERRRLMSPAALLSASPILVAPPGLYESVLEDAADPALVADHADLAETTGPYRDDGFPRPTAAEGTPPAAPSLVTALLAVLAALVLLGLPGASAPVSLLPEEPPDGQADSSGQPEPGGPVEASGAEAGSEASAAAPTGTEHAAEEETGEHTLLWTEGVDATGEGCVSHWALLVTAGGGTDVESGVLRVDWGTATETPMEPGGADTWRARVQDCPWTSRWPGR
ncbi:RNA polymerase sigma factor [Allosalinactinospora lopnorensis]|uniref:RNA polymerase sigma factor n=1 Tax=Allosalinactinospora lopnorensis TaxID=1352348 RepID=UPI000695B3B1|nr:RNA polymerase sigma factor [Allosalinactinospora lopnorensis]